MKILHVVDQISQEKHGGSAKVPYQLSEAQARLGHDVTIFASDYEAENQKPPEGVKLGLFHCVYNLLGGMKITPRMLLADFRQFDIIHMHNYRLIVNAISAVRGVPYVLQAHGTAAPTPESHTKFLYDAMWRNVLFNKARRYIADADAEVAQYIAEGANPSRIVVIPVGIDLDEYRQLPPKRASGKKVVLYLGRLHYNKGADILIRAIHLLNRDDVVLIIAGVDDGFGKELQELVNTLRLESKVVFLGPVYGKEKIQEYVDADVYVMPSRAEMWGLTFMEALACGTPVILSDKCEASKVLPSYCGWVSFLNPECMANVIDNMLTCGCLNKYRHDRMRWVSQYGWDSIAEKVIEMYRRVLYESITY